MYYRLDPTRTVRQSLAAKTVIEFPTLLVVTAAELPRYAVMTPAQPPRPPADPHPAEEPRPDDRQADGALACSCEMVGSCIPHRQLTSIQQANEKEQLLQGLEACKLNATCSLALVRYMHNSDPVDAK